MRAMNRTDSGCAAPRSHQRGFTLIEVLVSALVLVVGILGVAALQVTALKNLQSSGNYGIAAMLGNEMADRMWVANVNMNNDVDLIAAAYEHNAMPAEVPKDCAAEQCTAAEMAEYDVYQWQLQFVEHTVGEVEVPALLPTGQGSVTRTPGEDEFVITLRWDDDRSGSTGTNCPPLSDADLDCYQVVVNY